MKTLYKGFISPLLLALIVLLLIGGGAYVYTHNKQANQPAIILPTTRATETTFSVSPTSGKTPLTVTTVSFDGCNSELTWGDNSDPWYSGYAMQSCGGGVTHPTISKTHTYTTPGTYTISLYSDPPPASPVSTVTVTVIQTAQTSNSQTASWKTYTNTKYGFEFKYPDNFVKFFERDSTDANTAPLTVDFRVSGCFIVEGGGGLNDPKCRIYEVIVQNNKIIENGVGVSHTSTQMGSGVAEKLIWSEGGTSWTNIQMQYQGQWYIQQLVYPTGSSDDVLNIIAQSFRFIR